MILPTTVSTSNADAPTDSPAAFRSDVLDLINKFNQLLAHIPSDLPTKAELIAQSLIKGTTGGTGTAYTLSPAGSIASYAAGQSFWVTFHTASGASPTLQIGGMATPPALVRYAASGSLVNIGANELPAGFSTRVTLLSAAQALVEEMPPAVDRDATGNVGIGTVSPSVKLQINGDVAVAYQPGVSQTAGIRVGPIGSATQGMLGYDGSTGNLDISPRDGYSIVFRAKEQGNALARIATNGLQSSVIPGGSTLYPEFKCRAWVNFNGIGTVAIRASGNVSSITDNGVGDYTVNFATAMPDANYAVGGLGSSSGMDGAYEAGSPDSAFSASAFRIRTGSIPGVLGARDMDTVTANFFR